ncbi:hypothetical protein KZO84_05470 [Chromohalobacter canadensis]|nr:hypothetical protein [Chromohalobacter canadensis]MCT8498562.1 hypothetical protein [Chromohalobacter canadensis]
MNETAFFVFTSNSETFSYCLNDAKAMGAITFFPVHMYTTNIRNEFVVESYPESGIKYSSINDLIDKMKALLNDKEAMELESNLSRAYVEEKFSVEAIAENWKEIFVSQRKNKEKILIVGDISTTFTKEDLDRYIKQNGYKFVLCYMNKYTWGNDDTFTSYDPETGVVYIKYFLIEDEENELFRGFLNEGGFIKFSKGLSVKGESEDETYRYLKLLSRIYKIRIFDTHESIDSKLLQSSVDRVNREL